MKKNKKQQPIDPASLAPKATAGNFTLHSRTIGALPIINRIMERCRLRETLDTNYSQLVLEIIQHVITEFDLDLSELHNDSTTVRFYGDYELFDQLGIYPTANNRIYGYEDGKRRVRREAEGRREERNDERPENKSLVDVHRLCDCMASSTWAEIIGARPLRPSAPLRSLR